MSAGDSPPNPGQPKGPLNKSPHRTLVFGRWAGPLVLGALTFGVTYTYYANRAPKVPGTPSTNPLRTPGVKNIENAYSNGGATPTYTPAYGGTKQGSASNRSQDAGLRDGAATGAQLPKNLGTPGIGEDQKSTESGLKIWNDMKYGNQSGK